MKPSLLTTSILLALASTQTVYAAKPIAPSLNEPTAGVAIPAKKDFKFTWYAVKTATKYQFIVSTNEQFVDYDAKNRKCLKATSCFTTTVKSPSYTLLGTNPFLQKDNSYFWQVLAINNEGTSPLKKEGNLTDSKKSGEARPFSVSSNLAIPKIDDIFAPENAVTDSPFLFRMKLTTDLLDGYEVRINYGEGWKTMTGKGVSFTYTTTLDYVVPEQSYEVGLFDDTGAKIDNLSDYYSVSAGEETYVEPLPDEVSNTAPTVALVSGANSVVKNKTYTLKLKANDSDGNLNRVEVNWLDGSNIDFQTATNGATLTFTHTYKFAGIYPLIASAIDDMETYSEDFTKSLTVTEPAATTTTTTTTTVKVPSVSSINASPASVTQGETVTFSATLSAALPSGYTVKVNYGNGLVKMNGADKSFTLIASPLNSASYAIGVYDSKSVLKSNQLTGNFEITAPAPVNVSPTLSFVSGDTKATTGVSYSVKLSANDDDGNLSATVIDWGDGFTDTQTGATPTFTHTFTTAGSYSWSAIAYDLNDAASSAISKTVAVSKPVAVVTPTKTTGYSKIANDGSVLADSAKLGSGSKDWACTKDNKTGLIWEVKTTDGGLRDWNNYYTNYTADYPKCDWTDCEKDFKGKYGDSTNTDGFVTAVNAQGLCGASDWRLPTNAELRGLVYCSDGKYNKLADGDSDYICASNSDTLTTTSSPTINATYFPNTQQNWFWSSSPYAYLSNFAWYVNFYGGYSGYDYRDRNDFVRLVR